MSISAGFLRQKFPKRHARVVEECARLDVEELLVELSPLDRRIVRDWSPTAHPWLTVVRGRRGKVDPFWHVLCPRCRRRCETLYQPPGSQPNDWRCRRCHSLVYASQRSHTSHVSVQERRNIDE